MLPQVHDDSLLLDEQASHLMKVSPGFRRSQLRSKQQDDASGPLIPVAEISIPTSSVSTAVEVTKSIDHFTPNQARKTPIQHFQEIAQPRKTQAVS